MKKFLMGLTLALLSFICTLTVFACGGVEFKINFIVDGEVYATVNTGGGELIKMPDNPEKEEYAFDGWYWDKDVWDKPFTTNSLLDAPLSSDMSVYAKWIFNGETTPPYSEPTPEPPTVETTEYFTKQVDGSYYGKVYNTTTNFDFTDKIDYDGEYSVCTDAACTKPLADNKTSLNVGDNMFYILYDNGQKTTATVRRRLIYTVSFNSNGGTELSEQQVEEDRRAIAPKNPMRVGYTFNAWDRDFNEPIIDNTSITALWNANTNTPYKMEYYLQNLEDDNYTLQESDTENLTGTTDTTATATKTYEHFTIVSSTASKNISPDGTTVLQVYYDLDRLNVKIYASTDNISLSHYYDGQYKYGLIIPEITATYHNYLGYEWQGWFNDNGFFTKNFTLPSFTVDKNINYCAKGEKEEMSNFIFTSNENTCQITGIKDKTATEIIVPNYVTSINEGAFSGCSSLESICLPFVGGNIDTAGANSSTLFGYIFGTSSYTGGISTEQLYQNLTSSCTIYYIPSTLKNVTITGGNILYGAFYNCKNIIEISIGNGVANIEYDAFYYCSSLSNIIVFKDNAAYKSIDGILYNKEGTCLILYPSDKHGSSFTIPNGVTHIIRICSSYLNHIIIPSSVVSIRHSAFSECIRLEYATFERPSNWKTNSAALISSDIFSNPSTAALYLKKYLTGDNLTRI